MLLLQFNTNYILFMLISLINFIFIKKVHFLNKLKLSYSCISFLGVPYETTTN